MLELNAALPPEFVSTVEERVYLSLPDTAYPDVLLLHRPDEYTLSQISTGEETGTATADTPLSISVINEEVTEPYIEVRIAGSEDKVVAVIEVLSPKNKSREAKGRDVYVSKRDQLLHSGTHLIEIDLLREGAYTLAAPQDEVAIYQKNPWHYGVCLHRAESGRTFQLWLTSLRQRLPRFYVPLTPGYTDVVIDLQTCIERVYDGGLFDRRIDYRKEPIPPLAPTDAIWTDTLLKEKGLR